MSYVIPEEDMEDADFEELPDFPLDTIEEFNDLEAYLAIKNNKKTFVCNLTLYFLIYVV